jgi:hypothetical protein
MDHLHAVYGEIVSVKCENAPHAMDIHERNQSRVVHPDSGDSVLRDEAFPLLICQRGIRQHGQHALDLVHFGQRCRGGETKAVIRYRPGRYALFSNAHKGAFALCAKTRRCLEG